VKDFIAFLGPFLLSLAAGLANVPNVPKWVVVAISAIAAGIGGMAAKRVNKAKDSRNGE